MTGIIAGQLEAKLHVGIDLSELGSWMASEHRRVYLICQRILQDTDELIRPPRMFSLRHFAL